MVGGDSETQRESTRERMLRAGVDLFGDLALPDLLGGLNVSKVSRRARVTRPTFYANWETQADFVDDLVAHVLDPARLPLPGEVAEAVTTLATRNDGILAALHTLLQHDFESVVGDEGFAFEHVMWAKSRNPAVARRLSDYYETIDAEIQAAYELLLARWAREPRPPFTLRSIAVLFDSLVNGMAQRHLVDPDLATSTLYTRAVLMLIPTATRRIGETETVDDLVSVIERYPVESLAEDADDARATGDLPPAIGMPRLVDEIVVRLPAPPAPAEPAPTDADVAVAALRDAVDVLLAVLREHIGLSLAAVGIAVRYLRGDDITEPTGAVCGHLAELVAAAQAAGGVTSEPPAVEVAVLLARTALADVTMASPGGSADAVHLVLAGLVR